MLLISHRGNVNGRNPDMENNPVYIQEAIKHGFDVEVDVWISEDGEFYLGHDSPTYHVDTEWLKNESLWCHAKNIKALRTMLRENIHCFWHQEDDVVLTSMGYIWTYPNKEATDASICVLLNKNDKIPKNSFGICSDYVIIYKEQLQRIIYE